MDDSTSRIGLRQFAIGHPTGPHEIRQQAQQVRGKPHVRPFAPFAFADPATGAKERNVADTGRGTHTELFQAIVRKPRKRRRR